MTFNNSSAGDEPMTHNEPVAMTSCVLTTTPFCIYINVCSKNRYLAHKYLSAF